MKHKNKKLKSMLDKGSSITESNPIKSDKKYKLIHNIGYKGTEAVTAIAYLIPEEHYCSGNPSDVLEWIEKKKQEFNIV